MLFATEKIERDIFSFKKKHDFLDLFFFKRVLKGPRLIDDLEHFQPVE